MYVCMYVCIHSICYRGTVIVSFVNVIVILVLNTFSCEVDIS